LLYTNLTKQELLELVYKLTKTSSSLRSSSSSSSEIDNSRTNKRQKR
jgi:hypothetical protein